MADETRRILDLLAANKITVDEADQLLRAMARATADPAPPRDWRGRAGAGAVLPYQHSQDGTRRPP